MDNKYKKQFNISFSFTDIESPIVDEIDVSINSNESTIEIIDGSEKYSCDLVDSITAFIDKVNEIQLDRKSNYVFIECNGSGALHHIKATLSCKITKKTDQELKAEQIAIHNAEWQRKHEESMRLAAEKRKATKEAKLVANKS